MSILTDEEIYEAANKGIQAHKRAHRRFTEDKTNTVDYPANEAHFMYLAIAAAQHKKDMEDRLDRPNEAEIRKDERERIRAALVAAIPSLASIMSPLKDSHD